MTEAVTDPETPESPATGGARRLVEAWPGLAVVGVTLVAAFVAGTNLWFFSDDWNIVAGYHSGNLLEPFNSHLSLVPVGVYQLLFHTVGIDSYVPFRIVGLLAYAVLGWTTWRFARERLGDLGAALATALVLWNSGGVTNVMFPFLMNFSLPIAALAAIWWHLDRRTLRHDVAASVWLVVALATSGLGLMTAVAVAVELVWVAVADRRVAWRRWLTLAPGPVLWLGWYLEYGVDSPASGGLRPVLSYAARMLVGGFGSLVGGNKWLGAAVALIMTALACVAFLRRTLDARIAAALAAPVAFAVLTAVSRIGVVPAIPPDELRYQWTIGAFFVLAFVLLIAATRDIAPLASLATPVRVRALAAVVGVAILANVVVLAGDIGDWNEAVDTAVPGVRANLWEAETAAAAGVLDRDRALPVSYVKVTAGEYVDAVAELGSPLDGQSESTYGGGSDSNRVAVEAFVTDFGVAVDDAGPDDCAGTIAEAPEAAMFLVGSGQTVRIVAGGEPVDVRLSLFTTNRRAGATTSLGTLAPGDTGFFTFPDVGDLGPASPAVQVVGDAEVRSCS